MTMTDEATPTIEETFGPGETDDGQPETAAPFRFTDFEGLDVIGARLEIRNIAGGLRDAMDVEPVELHIGDEFVFSGRAVVRGIRVEPREKDDLTGPQFRVAISDATQIVIVDESLVQSEFAKQAEKLAEREQIKGQQKAEFPESDEPFFGYSTLPPAEVIERIDACDDDDEALVSAMETFEEAHENRPEILKAIKDWRDEA